MQMIPDKDPKNKTTCRSMSRPRNLPVGRDGLRAISKKKTPAGKKDRKMSRLAWTLRPRSKAVKFLEKKPVALRLPLIATVQPVNQIIVLANSKIFRDELIRRNFSNAASSNNVGGPIVNPPEPEEKDKKSLVVRAKDGLVFTAV